MCTVSVLLFCAIYLSALHILHCCMHVNFPLGSIKFYLISYLMFPKLMTVKEGMEKKWLQIYVTLVITQ